MANILYLLNSASGGATISALDAMDGLSRRGFRCFAALPPGAPEEELAPLRAVAAGLAAVPLPWWNRNYKARLWKRPLLWGHKTLRSGFHVGTLRRLSSLIRRWDISLVHTNTSLTPHGALASRIADVPHVWHIREQIGRRGLFRFWLPESVQAGLFVRWADALVANSEESRRFFQRTGHGEAVRVIYNGVRTDAFERPGREGELRRGWGFGEGGLLVGMVANLTSRMKRHDVFLRAAAQVAQQLPEARFVVVGQDPEQSGGFRGELEYARSLKALARELGLEERLVWAGFEADVPSVMRALDVVVHPSEQESFGRVAIEAMAAGVPVIGAATGGLAEIIEDGETGFQVADLDSQRYAERILELGRSRQLRERLGRRGARRAAESFSLERTVEQLEGVYRELLEAPA